MKIYTIDNGQERHRKGIAYGKRFIALPELFEKIIDTGGRIPHVRALGGAVLKYCSKCHEWRFIKKFVKNRCSKDGHKETCRDCDNARRRKRYRETRAVT